MVIKQVLLVLSLTAALAMSGCSRQQSDWEKTRATNTTDAYELFLKKYPSGEFSSQAQARVKELYEERDWQKARDTDTLEAYQAFLKQYPEGKWTEEARIRVENFTLASAPPNGTPPNGTPANGEATPDATPPNAATAPAARSDEAGSIDQAVCAGESVRWLPATPLRISRRDPMACSSARSSRALMRRTIDGQSSIRSILLLAGLSPSVTPKKGSSGTLYRLQVTHLSEKRASAICKALQAHKQGCVLMHP